MPIFSVLEVQLGTGSVARVQSFEDAVRAGVGRCSSDVTMIQRYPCTPKVT